MGLYHEWTKSRLARAVFCIRTERGEDMSEKLGADNADQPDSPQVCLPSPRLPVQLNDNDRRHLEVLANRKMRPTSRQKALALIRLDSGKPLLDVSQEVGIAKDELELLVSHFNQGGLKAVGLINSTSRKSGHAGHRRSLTIEQTPGVCGGSARVAGTRIPVWQLVAARRAGASEAELLTDFPRLTARNLVDAWEYASDHQDEINAEIHANEVA
jgi:uncharacterized protein (DUF433 family)